MGKDDQQIVPERPGEVTGTSSEYVCQAIARTSPADPSYRRRSHGRRTAHSGAAKDKGRQFGLDQSRGCFNGQLQEPWPVSGAVDERNAAVDECACERGQRLMECQIDEGLDSSVVQVFQISNIPAVSDLERVVTYPAHMSQPLQRPHFVARRASVDWDVAVQVLSSIAVLR